MELRTPSTDIGDLSERLGIAWGVTCGEPIIQYLAWSEDEGLLEALSRHEHATLDVLSAATALSDSGLDALLCILGAIGLVRRRTDGAYVLTAIAREYLLPDSPYYVGSTLYLGYERPLPDSFARPDAARRSHHARPKLPWTAASRLPIQHDRNFGPCVVAARSGCFARVRHLVDLGGGSGTFAIPLVMDRPDVRVTLVELPDVVPHVSAILARYGVADRIDLRALDLLDDNWDLPPCDTLFFGNVFHTCNDEECRHFAAESFKALPPGGEIWLHEVLMGEDRDGPLLSALWNANMAARKGGSRQRSVSELHTLLRGAGFSAGPVIATAGRFSLVGGVKPGVLPEDVVARSR